MVKSICPTCGKQGPCSCYRKMSKRYDENAGVVALVLVLIAFVAVSLGC